MVKVTIKQDGDGYLAKVEGYDNLFAFGYSKEEAKAELLNVVEMMMDYNLELVEKQRILRNKLLLEKAKEYAV